MMRVHRVALCLAAILLAASVPVPAQVRSTEDIPSFTPVEAHPDGSVTFSMYAPEAKSVELRGRSSPSAGAIPSGCPRTAGASGA